jgi:hypothetical protein
MDNRKNGVGATKGWQTRRRREIDLRNALRLTTTALQTVLTRIKEGRMIVIQTPDDEGTLITIGEVLDAADKALDTGR